jgi:hypothetical protein
VQFALKEDLRAEAAVTGDRAVCPLCRAVVIAKCGRIKIHHWAHEAGADCDTWSEPMTQWHLDWQGCWPERQREWPIGPHRADVLTVLKEPMPWLVQRGIWHYLGNTGIGLQAGGPLVVEFQHSHLPADGIAERETYYGKHARQMIWVWDCRKPFGDRRLYLGSGRGGQRSFTWKHFRNTLARCSYPVFLDFGGDEDLLLVIKWPPYKRQYGETTEFGTNSWMGWGDGAGYQINKRAFIKALQLPGGAA